MNLKTKTNTVKQILARVTLIVLMLLVAAISFSSCLWLKGKVERVIMLNSHEEFVEFIEKYNSQNDRFVYTFISFNFDNNNKISTFGYELDTLWEMQRSMITEETKYSEMYDKDHSKYGFACKMIFHMNDVSENGDFIDGAYQITCKYVPSNKYNFYQGDTTSIEFIHFYHINDDFMDYEELQKKFNDQEDFRIEFADMRSRNYEAQSHGDLYSRYYNYMYVYSISINEKSEIRVQITSEIEISQEKLDEICQLLMDNIVIINTEG